MTIGANVDQVQDDFLFVKWDYFLFLFCDFKICCDPIAWLFISTFGLQFLVCVFKYMFYKISSMFLA